MKRFELLAVFFLVLSLGFCFVKLIPKFSNDYSFAVYDRQGNLLNAQVSKDEQWRFSQIEKLSENYKACAILYEDKNFYFHFGVDPLAVFRAMYLNLKHRRIISGASTISMQVARISEKNKTRSIAQKVKETFLSLILELAYSKNEILNLYANNAPYGGNVVGISAASWRYFSRPQSNLSLAELACLAVLPNDPSLVRPGVNETVLTEKRDRLLQKLLNTGMVEEGVYSLAILEPVPTKPKPLPNIVPHYAQFLKKQTNKNIAKTDINLKLQLRTTEIMEMASFDASRSGVHNACAIILENKTNKVLAYVGNTGLMEKNRIVENEAVDMIQAKRSSGSLLKPFLYAVALDTSLILPSQLIPDLPTQFGSYIPLNNTHYFLGAVSADEALSKSLNVPFVYLLSEYSVESFLELLQKLGLTTFTQSAEYYGLPLILGGGELKLFEIAQAYKNLALKAFDENSSENSSALENFPLSAPASRLTLDALINGTRPSEEATWNYFSNSKQIAWKTGTSYGNKDAWTIGVTPDYTVGVWFGNASGVGRPEITSTRLAAPAMFKLFELLPSSEFLPHNELLYKSVNVCKHSGYIASPFCDETKQIQIPKKFLINKACPFCKPIALSADEKYRITDIEKVDNLPVIKSFFTLPPAQEYYYAQAHPDYKKLPPKLEEAKSNLYDFQIIFPKNYSNIFIPTQLDGSIGAFVAKVAYNEKNKELFWYLDQNFLTTTKGIHEVKISTSYGKHRLTIVDSSGNEESLVFFVLSE
ncbi:MAG: penicillin-binding protein 1C [Treponemataceae bacterium]